MDTSTWLLLATFAAGGLLAETSGDVKVDTPQVKAVVVTIEPHRPGLPQAFPMGGVLVFLGPGRMSLSSASGKAEKIDLKAGDFHWIPAGSFAAENTGDGAFRMVEIELKTKPQGPLPATDLDPVKVDPQHYRAEFENEQVRVLRVRYGPHEKGALHEHKLNRVVCYITDHPGLKAGEVRIAGAAKHTEENASDQTVERIAVELK